MPEPATTVAAGADPTATAVPAQMTLAAAADALGKLTVTEADTPAPVAATEHPAPGPAAKPEAETKPVEPTKPEDEGKLPDAAQAEIEKHKAEADAARADAAAARAEAETLKAQAEAARTDQIIKAGILPELLDKTQAEAMKQYDDALATVARAKIIQRSARDKIAAGTHVDADGKELVFTDSLDGQQQTLTARQWQDKADDARDEANRIITEVAPIASAAKRQAAQRQSDIYKAGLEQMRQREAAAKKVAAVAAKEKPPVTVPVRPATGVPRGTSTEPRKLTNEQFVKMAAELGEREAAGAAMAQLTT